MPAILPPGSPSRAWLAVAVWMALTVVLSSLPFHGVQPSVPDADKLVHAAVYCVMAVLCARAWTRHGSPQGAMIERTIAMALIFGALMEIMQGHVGRDMSLADWVADGVGAVIGIGMWKAWMTVSSSTPERLG